MKKIIFLFFLVLFVFILPATVLGGNKPGACYVPSTHITIQSAVNDTECSEIMVAPGNWAGAIVNRQVQIKGTGNASITTGPLHVSGLIQGFRFVAGSDGSSVSHLNFYVDLVIMNGAAVNDVEIANNNFYNSVQAISNWRGNDWNIHHNTIEGLRTRNGGGIGILIGDYSGGVVENNVVSHNNISGTLDTSYVGEGGGYNGSGIVLFADFRWGAAGALEIKNNNVVQNKVSLVSNNSNLVDVVAFEMTDTRDDEDDPVIFDNSVGFNDWRGTVIQMDLTPDNLEDVNNISRNLGDNRGHGLHPSILLP
ncbi:MAG: hypothetical protein UV46_C0025G0004 [Candidatus Gottesmanbacteria bacterium GW2011_GWC2_42_8]|nr:MAG: hypothetical protein UV46_C0025G0004 [Candidatus Gottesmanbacteria bacterium GW2011_GWC2_42_8]